jgi:hypothetical protein
LDVEDIKLNTDEITKLYDLPHLEYLSTNKFAYDVSTNMQLERHKTECPQSRLATLEFWRAQLLGSNKYSIDLVRNHPCLKSLAWVIHIGGRRGPWLPDDFCRAVREVKTQLTQLHLSLIDTHYFEIDAWQQMDFVAFSSLKTLITHAKLIFTSSVYRKPQSDRMDLVRRLPAL